MTIRSWAVAAAGIAIGSIRVMFWGAVAMALTGVGALFGTVV